MSNYENTQLTNVATYDASNMVFSEPMNGSIPDSKPAINFKRILISTRNPDGSTGELVLPTTRLFSFGVSENTSQETGKVNGYTFPICLWNKDGASDEEKQWVNCFNNIVDRCVDHLVDNRDDIEKYELEKSDLKKFNPLYYKREKFTGPDGKTGLRVVPGTGPTLYAKLIFSKKNDKFITQFFDVNDQPMNVLDLLGKYCYCTGAVKIESIFIGNKISLQVKLYEAVIEPVQTGMGRLLKRVPQSKILQNKTTPVPAPPSEDSYNSDIGSIQDSDSDSDSELFVPQNKPEPKKRATRGRGKAKK